MATRRGYYRAEMKRAVANIEMALTHLVRLIEPYSQAHPEISSAIEDICSALVAIGEAIEKVHDSI
jgi:hypothetical protein